MTIRIEELPDRRFAHVRATGPYHVVIKQSFAKLHQLVGPRGLLRPGAMMIAVCWDSPERVPAEQLRSDAALSVTSDYTGDAELPVMTLPGGRFAIVTHRGGYKTLPDTWNLMYRELIPDARLIVRPTAPPFEHYINDCTEVPVEDLLTDIYVPVE
jgi:AraC family transcriptional regulator